MNKQPLLTNFPSHILASATRKKQAVLANVGIGTPLASFGGKAALTSKSFLRGGVARLGFAALGADLALQMIEAGYEGVAVVNLSESISAAENRIEDLKNQRGEELLEADAIQNRINAINEAKKEVEKACECPTVNAP